MIYYIYVYRRYSKIRAVIAEYVSFDITYRTRIFPIDKLLRQYIYFVINASIASADRNPSKAVAFSCIVRKFFMSQIKQS